MTEEKPFSIPAIIAAMKEVGFTTQSDLVKLRGEIKKDTDEAIHNQLTEFYAGRIQPEFDKAEAKNEERFQKLEQRMERMDQRMETLEAGQSHIRDDIKGLEGELSATPSRREFEELKTRVNRLEQTN